MMGSLLDVAVRRAGNGGFDLPVAALAGGAAAALLFLMPVDVLQNLVIDSGLPGLFPPAEPPLGLKARAILSLVAAAVAFASVYGLMRLLGRKPARKAKPEDEEDFFAEPAPRMRRRDFHPDAPARAPLSALRHLGDPEKEAEAEAPLILTDPIPEIAPEAIEPVAEEDELVLEEPEAVEEPAPLPAAEVVDEPLARPQGDATIAELLARLERALEQKPLPQWIEPAQARPQAASQPAPADEEAEPMDVRLRSALENLKRFAPSHG